MSIEVRFPTHLEQLGSAASPMSRTQDGSQAIGGTEAPDDMFQPKFRWYVAIRPIFDSVIGLCLLIGLIPVIIVAALGVKLTSTGPAFYRQTRLGRYGRKFTMTKIRTMVDDAESGTGPVWAATDDPRITRLGRFLRSTHIDEFPQLINVVLGQMSLIGPRPERPEIASSLKWDIPHFDQRLQVRPGITGLSQLTLPPDTDIDGVRKKFLSDTYYIRYMNPWLDARIAFGTLLYLLRETWYGIRQLISLPCAQCIEQKIGTDINSEAVSMICGSTGCDSNLASSGPPESTAPEASF